MTVKADASYADVTPDDEELGNQALVAGKVAFVIDARGIGSQDKDIDLGVSWLSWMLMLGGGLPVVVVVAPDSLETYGESVKAITVGPKTRGTFVEGSSLHEALFSTDDIFDEGIEHLFLCDGSNLLSAPHAGVVGWYLRDGCHPTFEVVEEGDRSVFTGNAVVRVADLRAAGDVSLSAVAVRHGSRLLTVPREARYLPTDTEDELAHARQVLMGYKG